MAIEWYWNKPIGYIIERTEKGKEQRIDLYKGINCDIVETYEYAHNGKPEKGEAWLFAGFLCGIDHIRRCFGLDGGKNLYRNAIEWHLDLQYPEAETLSQTIIEAAYPTRLVLTYPPEEKPADN